MKKIITTMLMGSLIGLSACSNSEEISEALQIPLEVSIKGAASRNIITGTTLPDGSQLGIFTVAGSTVNTQNLLVTYADNQCKLAEPVFLDKTQQEVYAYYPYSAEGVSLEKMELESMNQTDYLYGYSADSSNKLMTVNASQPKADLYLKHALARVTLSIKIAPNNTADYLALTEMFMGGTPYSATLNIKTGEVTNRDGSIDLVIKTAEKISKETATLVNALVIPCNETNVFLSLVIDGKSCFTQINSATWKSGMQYTYNVEIGNGNLKVSEAEITPWNNNEQGGIEVGDKNYVE